MTTHHPTAHPPLDLRLDQVPFSTAGSYLAVSHLAAADGLPEGLWVRSVHGASARRQVAMISFGGGSALPLARYEDGRLTVTTETGTGRMLFPSPGHLELQAIRGPLRLTVPALGGYDVVVETIPSAEWQLLRLSNELTLRLSTGDPVNVQHEWNGETSKVFTLEAPEGATLHIHESESTPAGSGETERSPVPDFGRFLKLMPKVRSDLRDTRTLAAYVMWSALVEPRGHLRRPTMYMSKNWMCGVWSWDHCFNALALTASPSLARDQFLTVFDQQLPSGRLPDISTDNGSSYVYVKPPIHGWALERLLDAAVGDESFLAEVYPRLAASTEWWLRERVFPGRRLPHYFHGNDSGWDNGTIFTGRLPLEAPDLAALLVIQLHTLARLSRALGRDDEAPGWERRADDLQDALMRELWTGDRFVARSSATGAVVDTPTLQLFVPLVLGHRLPEQVRADLTRRLLASGLLTDYGLATESVRSPLYADDGYWRGPIWAPSTLMMVEALRATDSEELAADIADRFTACIAEHGMAENFDARTGHGLRDRAYSWTASVFLLLASTHAPVA